MSLFWTCLSSTLRCSGANSILTPPSQANKSQQSWLAVITLRSLSTIFHTEIQISAHIPSTNPDHFVGRTHQLPAKTIWIQVSKMATPLTAPSRNRNPIQGFLSKKKPTNLGLPKQGSNRKNDSSHYREHIFDDTFCCFPMEISRVTAKTLPNWPNSGHPHFGVTPIPPADHLQEEVIGPPPGLSIRRILCFPPKIGGVTLADWPSSWCNMAKPIW